LDSFVTLHSKDITCIQPLLELITQSSGLYYKPMTIVNDDSRVVNKLKTLLTDDARVVIYDHHMFIVQAPDSVLGSIL
jgi:hypothetical protein